MIGLYLSGLSLISLIAVSLVPTSLQGIDLEADTPSAADSTLGTDEYVPVK